MADFRLEVFYTVAKRLSFTKAAAELVMTQPAVTQHSHEREEQYNAKLQSQDWSKDETDYLLGLVQEYDLRWPVIWDRYEYQPPALKMESEFPDSAMVAPPKVRSMEDMKARYYSVAAAMMKINTPVELMNHAEFNLVELMNNFDPARETTRKKFAEAAFRRTKEEAAEEQSLLMELKRILARSEKLSE